VNSFVEKPKDPPTDQVNMGVYIFTTEALDRLLWEDHHRSGSSHDFGRDILPGMIQEKRRVFAYPYAGYWVDVGTIRSYWQAHMDLLKVPPPIDLNDRRWVVHTRSEERPPVRLAKGSVVENSMLSDGVVVEAGARIINSVLSPGVVVRSGATVSESVLLTDTIVGSGGGLERVVTDKRVKVGENARLGSHAANAEITVVGKNSEVPPSSVLEPGVTIGVDVAASDYPGLLVKSGDSLQTKRKPYEI
jgi:glucose-1-phosphate adenylyltransferase